MREQDMTDMGGAGAVFLTTHWSMIERVKAGRDPDRALIGLLLVRYWKPVYCYVRRKGFGNEQAKDLTQGFFHEVVLNRQLINRADDTKGRFRWLMLHALNQYMVDEARKETASKRIPPGKLVSFDIADPSRLPEEIQNLSPDESFNHVWKAELLKRALTEVEVKYRQQGRERYWHVFQDRVVEPALQDHAPPSLSQLCQRYGISDEATASDMIRTVKKRVRRTLASHVRQTVAADAQAEAELQSVIRLLGQESHA